MPRMGTFLPFRLLSSCFFKSAKLSKIEEGVRTLGDNMVRVVLIRSVADTVGV